MNQTMQIERIRAQYQEREATKFDELKALDRKVKRTAEIFAYTFGSAGALVLGTGMSLAMKVIGSSMALGIGVGLVGLGIVSVTYPIYKAILKARKQKYAKDIFALTDDLLNK